MCLVYHDGEPQCIRCAYCNEYVKPVDIQMHICMAGMMEKCYKDEEWYQMIEKYEDMTIEELQTDLTRRIGYFRSEGEQDFFIELLTYIKKLNCKIWSKTT